MAAFVGLCWFINCSLSLGLGIVAVGIQAKTDSSFCFTNECTNFGQSPVVRAAVSDSMTTQLEIGKPQKTESLNSSLSLSLS